MGVQLNYAAGFLECVDEIIARERLGSDVVVVPEVYSSDALARACAFCASSADKRATVPSGCHASEVPVRALRQEHTWHLMPVKEAWHSWAASARQRSTHWSRKASCRSLRSAAAHSSKRKTSMISSGGSDMTRPFTHKSWGGPNRANNGSLSTRISPPQSPDKFGPGVGAANISGGIPRKIA
jgi:hypothetical protein